MQKDYQTDALAKKAEGYLSHVDQIDMKRETRYTQEVIRASAMEVLRMLWGADSSIAGDLAANLDNGTVYGDVCHLGGETGMASKVRRTYNYTDANGELCSIVISAPSERAADMKFQQFILQGVKKPAPTVRQFVEETYRDAFIAGLKPSTRENYEQYLQLNILPYMGEMPMDMVTIETVQKFQNWMANAKAYGRKNNLNADTIRRVCGLAGRIFKVAAEMGLIEKSPFQSTLLRNPGKKGGHHKALPDAEIDRIKAEIPGLENTEEQLYMALLVYTGMRKEEILGLRWEELDLDMQCGTIKRAVTYPGNNKPHVDTTKTECSERTVILPEGLKLILMQHKQAQGYVLGGDKPLCYSTVKRIQQRAFKALNIVGYSNHDFRTTYGTQLKESGMTSAIVADLLGHSDTRMVETVYARTRRDGVMKHLQAVEQLNRKARNIS